MSDGGKEMSDVEFRISDCGEEISNGELRIAERRISDVEFRISDWKERRKEDFGFRLPAAGRDCGRWNVDAGSRKWKIELCRE